MVPPSHLLTHDLNQTISPIRFSRGRPCATGIIKDDDCKKDPRITRSVLGSYSRQLIGGRFNTLDYVLCLRVCLLALSGLIPNQYWCGDYRTHWHVNFSHHRPGSNGGRSCDDCILSADSRSCLGDNRVQEEKRGTT